MSHCMITAQGDGSYHVETSHYNRAFVAELKDAVPWTKRDWDGGRRVWIVRGHEAALRRLAVEHFKSAFLKRRAEESAFEIEDLHTGDVEPRGGPA